MRQNNFHRDLQSTSDGSFTLYIPEIDEHYHSTNGAIQEALHVYISSGLHYWQQNNPLKLCRILEVGFGTGLNAFLTLLDSLKSGNKVLYTTIELYPLSIEQIEKMNYAQMLAPEMQNLYMKLHTSAWNQEVEITPEFHIIKKRFDLVNDSLSDVYDLVYFDAFAPEKQPEMWSESIYSKVVQQMAPQSVLTTYCAKGAVRRGWRDAGLTMQRIPGPPGKREMLRGIGL